MVIPINERLLSGRKLYISQNGTGGPVIFWGMYPHRGNEVEHLRESLMEIAPGQNFMLVADVDRYPGLAPSYHGSDFLIPYRSRDPLVLLLPYNKESELPL